MSSLAERSEKTDRWIFDPSPRQTHRRMARTESSECFQPCSAILNERFLLEFLLSNGFVRIPDRSSGTFDRIHETCQRQYGTIEFLLSRRTVPTVGRYLRSRSHPLLNSLDLSSLLFLANPTASELLGEGIQSTSAAMESVRSTAETPGRMDRPSSNSGQRKARRPSLSHS